MGGTSEVWPAGTKARDRRACGGLRVPRSPAWLEGGVQGGRSERQCERCATVEGFILERSCHYETGERLAQ